MKHAAPLSPFQEKLFDVVLNAFQNKEIKNVSTKQDVMQRKQLEKELHKESIKLTEEIKEYPQDTWKDNLKFWISCMKELVIDHINGIFLSIMSINILYMQILTVHMSTYNSKRMAAEVFKWVMIVITLFYIIYLMIQRLRAAGNRLKEWTEKKNE